MGLAGALDGLIVAYLLAHGVIALLCDIQSILPDANPSLHESYRAAGLVDIVQGWGRDQGDFLVLENPTWFKALIWAEVSPSSLGLSRRRSTAFVRYAYCATVKRQASAACVATRPSDGDAALRI
jgi:hypothetical protein